MVNDSTVVVFDDQRVVANAGVMLPGLLARRLGIEHLVDTTVRLGDRPVSRVKESAQFGALGVG